MPALVDVEAEVEPCRPADAVPAAVVLLPTGYGTGARLAEVAGVVAGVEEGVVAGIVAGVVVGVVATGVDDALLAD